MRKNVQEILVSGKSVIYSKNNTRKSRFYLIFDRIENGYAVGKTFPRKAKKQREEKINLDSVRTHMSVLSLVDYSQKFIVTKRMGNHRFLCSKNMNNCFSKSLNQAQLFDSKEEALSFSQKFGGKVVSHQKALNLQQANA